MARKNARHADQSGDILFDQRTKAVMAQPMQEGIKEKVQSVREVVPGKSNNEIVLVLQYFDYNVEQAIQAYLEDGAKQAIQAWHQKPNSKKKNKKKKPKQTAATPANQEQATNQPANATNQPANREQATNQPANREQATNQPANQEQATNRSANREQARNKSASHDEALHHSVSSDPFLTQDVNKHPHSRPTEAIFDGSIGVSSVQSASDTAIKPDLNGPTLLKENTEPASTVAPSGVTAKTTAARSNVPAHNTRPHHEGRSHANRPKTLDAGGHSHGRDRGHSNRHRTVSDHSTSSMSSEQSTKPYAGLEKSMRDLQRQTSSLQRLKLILNEDVEKAYKNITKVFDELREAMNDREAEMIFELDKVKDHAKETLGQRQNKASQLKLKTDRAQVMSEREIAELRADIKHFVIDRQVDEEVSKAARFNCDGTQLLQKVRTFGEVMPLKGTYSQRRPSISSVSSSVVSHEELTSPSTPLTPTTPSVFTPTMPATSGSSVNAVHSGARTDSQVSSQPAAPLSVQKPPKKSLSAAQSSGTDSGAQNATDTHNANSKKSRNSRRRRQQQQRQQEWNSQGPNEEHVDNLSSRRPDPTYRRNQMQRYGGNQANQKSHSQLGNQDTQPGPQQSRGPDSKPRSHGQSYHPQGQGHQPQGQGHHGQGDQAEGQGHQAQGQGSYRQGQGSRTTGGRWRPQVAPPQGHFQTKKSPVSTNSAITSSVASSSVASSSVISSSASVNSTASFSSSSESKMAASTNSMTSAAVQPNATGENAARNSAVAKVSHETNEIGSCEVQQHVKASEKAANVTIHDSTVGVHEHRDTVAINGTVHHKDITNKTSTNNNNNTIIVKKSVVSVESNMYQDSNALPQRKARDRRPREVKRAEVIVNGNMNNEVNGIS